MKKLAFTTAIALALATAAYAQDHGRGMSGGGGGGGGGQPRDQVQEVPADRGLASTAPRGDRAAAPRPAWDPIGDLAISRTAHPQT